MSQLLYKASSKNSQRRRILTGFGVVAALMLVGADAFAAGGGHDGHGFPVPHFIATVINFLIFMGILRKYAWPKIQGHFKQRHAKLTASLNEAKRLKEEAEQTLAQYRQRLDALEDERQQLLDEYHKQGQREKERIVEDAKAQVEKMRADAKLLIEQETKKAIANIEKKAVDEALMLSKVILTERLHSKTSQVKLIDSYIDDLGKVELGRQKVA